MKTKILGTLFCAAIATPALADHHESDKMKHKTKAETKEQTQDSANKSDEKAALVVTHYTFAKGTGCWATLYNDNDFTGEALTLVGQQDLPDVELDLKPYQLGGSPDSVRVGPQAELALYGDENYENQKKRLSGGEEVKDLSVYPFWAEIESIKLNCKPSQTAE